MAQSQTNPWLFVKRRSVVVPPKLMVDKIKPSVILTAYSELKDTSRENMLNKFREIFPQMQISYSSYYYGGTVLITFNDTDFVMWDIGERYFLLLEGHVWDDTPQIIRFGWCTPGKYPDEYDWDFIGNVQRQRNITSCLLEGLIELGLITDYPKEHKYPIAQVEPKQSWGDFNKMRELAYFFDSLSTTRDNVILDIASKMRPSHIHLY